MTLTLWVEIVAVGVSMLTWRALACWRPSWLELLITLAALPEWWRN